MKLLGTSLLVLMAATTLVASTAVTPAEAIRASVLRRLGVPGVVDVVHVTTKVADEVGLVASPRPPRVWESLPASCCRPAASEGELRSLP